MTGRAHTIAKIALRIVRLSACGAAIAMVLAIVGLVMTAQRARHGDLKFKSDSRPLSAPSADTAGRTIWFSHASWVLGRVDILEVASNARTLVQAVSEDELRQALSAELDRLRLGEHSATALIASDSPFFALQISGGWPVSLVTASAATRDVSELLAASNEIRGGGGSRSSLVAGLLNPATWRPRWTNVLACAGGAAIVFELCVSGAKRVKRLRRGAGTCRHCGHRIVGVVGQCPECGSRIESGAAKRNANGRLARARARVMTSLPATAALSGVGGLCISLIVAAVLPIALPRSTWKCEKAMGAGGPGIPFYRVDAYHAPGFFRVESIWLTSTEGVTIDPADFSAKRPEEVAPPWITYSTPVADSSPNGVTVVEIRSGFPWPCFTGCLTLRRDTKDYGDEDESRAPDTLTTTHAFLWTDLSQVPFLAPELLTIVPLRPLWPQLAANTATWGLVVFALLFGLARWGRPRKA
ncbi:MAG: hypothetical protein U0572_12555 [Phycisphaerales bacterium]